MGSSAAVRRAFYIGAAAALFGCGANTTPGIVPSVDATDRMGRRAEPVPRRPILIAADLANDTLEYWPIRRDGGSAPRYLAGGLVPGPANGLAADGNLIAMALGTSPNGMVELYDAGTHVTQILADPFGTPVNIAIDKKANIYALNAYGSVTVYKHGSLRASVRRCPGISETSAIGLDNEGDLFVGGRSTKTPRRSPWKVFEFPSGSRACRPAHLHTHSRVTGIGADPKTDDLIVIERSAANSEMIVYPKPYQMETARRHILHVVTAAGDFRLSANSTHIFYRDALSIGYGYYPIIDQAAYPSGKFEGYYQNGFYGSTGFIGGFTTIPNTLPN